MRRTVLISALISFVGAQLAQPGRGGMRGTCR